MTPYARANAIGIVGLYGLMLAGLMSAQVFHTFFGTFFAGLFLYGVVYTATHQEDAP